MLERVLRPHLDWADVVFMDWCKAGAALLTRIDPGTTRVMIRLHSQEVFTDWPYLVDWSRVDDLIFVSDHLRDYTRAAVPSVTAPGGPRLSVLPNAMDLRPYARPKPADARFTVGLVGFSAIAKDPRWAIEVLRRLRRQDPRYRLLLIGGDVRGRVSAAAGRYDRAYRRDLAELEPAGAVRRYGPTDDVPAALTGVGTILSSSVRESFHCGLFEGAASGAVPVVRDWPFFPGAALRMFPADWVVTSPDQAADRILAVTGSEPTWRAAGAAAAAEVLDRWDWPVIAAAYDEAIGGELNTSV
jgi:glycosyltransferase involved in cell wall biosynthesis